MTKDKLGDSFINFLEEQGHKVIDVASENLYHSEPKKCCVSCGCVCHTRDEIQGSIHRIVDEAYQKGYEAGLAKGDWNAEQLQTAYNLGKAEKGATYSTAEQIRREAVEEVIEAIPDKKGDYRIDLPGLKQSLRDKFLTQESKELTKE